MIAPVLAPAPTRRAYLNANYRGAGARALNGEGGILIDDGWILAVGPKVTKETIGVGTQIFDCTGLTLIPGLIDMRVFTGEPGTEYRETLATASEAAAAGGVTTMIVMPNTQPVIDDAALVDFILRRARDTAMVRVAPMAAITKGLAGEMMSEIGTLKEAGAVAVTDAYESGFECRSFPPGADLCQGFRHAGRAACGGADAVTGCDECLGDGVAAWPCRQSTRCRK